MSVRPKLIRQNTAVVVPKTVRIVVQPSSNKSVSLQQIKQSNPIQNGKPKVSIVNNAAVSNKSLVKKKSVVKKTEVKYVTQNTTLESIARIKAIRGIGRGKTLVIIGNGPSIIEADLGRLKNKPNIDTLSINRPDERLWPTTYWSFFDNTQTRRHEGLWSGYDGTIFNSTAIKKQKQKSMNFKNINGKGFSKDAAKGIHIGRSSVYASMQIALWMDYDHIFIFGCDMNPDGLNGKLHFYGTNPDVDPNIRKSRFKGEAEYYEHAATLMTPEERAKFTFCTEYNPWDFVKEFKQISHKSAVQFIIDLNAPASI